MNKNAEDFRNQFISQLEKIQKEYYSTIQVLENKNNNLIKEIQELQDYLIKRPSKDEDIETINRLKDEINMLEKKMADSDSLIEQFRNELINREETYNGYFGRKPEVGFMNPLKGKEVFRKTNTQMGNQNNLMYRK
jgi:predicted RNase H-like nuclease (RuvC/YqgF family)